MLNFSQKVVFLTGGNGGIGKAAVNAFLGRGAKVVAADSTYPSTELSNVDFNKNPLRLYLDVKDSTQVNQVIDLIALKYKKLDVVVNCAGILSTTPFIEIEEQYWDEVMAVNVKGTLFVCQAALKYMINRNSGCIINIASISGKRAGILAGADYAASKAAVISLTRSAALVGAKYGVRANSIAPGGINTAMIDRYFEVWPDACEKVLSGIPLGRWGKPIEVANTILFLASDEAHYITGECVNVNGGDLME